MAATKSPVDAAEASSASPTTSSPVFGSITLAALALPGLIATTAQAESAPTEGVVSLKIQAYNDWQPGLDRIKVVAPSLYVFAPIASQWSIEGSAVHDNISGASPRWHTNISGASHMHDNRTAGTAKVTRYFDRWSIGVGASSSNENDYRSTAASVDARISSADNNTTWYVGAGWSSDNINPVNEVVVDEHKRTQELMLGVTQVWTKNDLLQLNLGHVRGRGYFNDPYKLADRRPRERDQTTVLLRWNHYVEPYGATVRSSYRFYRDTFGIDAHSLQLEVAHPLGERFTLTPSVRYYTQSAANFYFDPVYDPVIGEPFPVGHPKYFSPDQRLSAFGALTVGAKFEWKIDSRWSADIKYERYEQRSGWRLGGGGSPGLASFSAQFMQVGISRKF